MVSSLPQPVRLRLEQALAQWRHWTPAPDKQPRPLQVLADGLSNTSVRVAAGSRDWVVRIDGIAPAKIGLNRSAEWRSLQLAAVAGLSPVAVYQNPQLGVLVTGFQPADTSLPEQRRDLAATAELLRGIHAMPRVKFRLDPLDRARHYLHLLGADGPAESLVCACERLARRAFKPVLCHNDLLRANRLWSGGRLLALDWEYVAVGDPFFDLAVIIEGDELSESDSASLVQAWLQRDPSEEEQARLADNQLAYRELSSLWWRVFQKLAWR
jgi:thiamine kinase